MGIQLLLTLYEEIAGFKSSHLMGHILTLYNLKVKCEQSAHSVRHDWLYDMSVHQQERVQVELKIIPKKCG